MNRTPEQEADRRAKQRATAAQPDCGRCRNKAPINDTLCASCRRAQDALDFAEDQVKACNNTLMELLIDAGVVNPGSVITAIGDLIEAMIERNGRE